MRIYFFNQMWLFIIYKKFPLNRGWKVNGTRFLGSFRWKFSESNMTSEKVEPFLPVGMFLPVGLLQKEVRFPFLQTSLIPCSGLRGHFLLKETDLYTERVNVIPGRNLLVLNFAHHLPKP